VRSESFIWLPLGATGIRAPVGSPNLADREAMVAVNSEVVTTQATAVRILGRLSSPYQRGKNTTCRDSYWSVQAEVVYGQGALWRVV